MPRLLSALWWFLAAVMLWFHNELNQHFAAHPAALWIAMGIMLVFCFGKAVQRELDKAKRSDHP
jgi:hypothetical protein